MFVRSQDRKILIETNYITVSFCNKSECNVLVKAPVHPSPKDNGMIVVGTYPNVQRAQEILDEIQSLHGVNPDLVFEMPGK